MIELSEVKIKDLLRSSEFQMRDGLDLVRILQYAKSYREWANMPPVTVAQVSTNGDMILVDGFHRVDALEHIGRGSVTACVHKVATRKEALLMAARANNEHGKELTRGEKHKAFRAYVGAGGHLDRHHSGGGRGRPPTTTKSYRVIAGELGGTVGHSTISRWMKEDFPQVAAKLAKDKMPWNGEGEGYRPPTFEEKEQSRVREAMEEALKAFRGITSRRMRGKLIWEAEELVTKMKARGAYKQYEPPGF